MGCVGVANPYRIRPFSCLKPVLPTRHAYCRNRLQRQGDTARIGPLGYWQARTMSDTEGVRSSSAYMFERLCIAIGWVMIIGGTV
jgi:hypothetical protein